jgi:chaperonin cofactor prefoldin
MSDLEKDVATLNERTSSHNRRLDKLEAAQGDKLEGKDVEPLDKRVQGLESNQRWFVLTTIGLMLKAAFDYFKSGGSP